MKCWVIKDADGTLVAICNSQEETEKLLSQLYWMTTNYGTEKLVKLYGSYYEWLKNFYTIIECEMNILYPTEKY